MVTNKGQDQGDYSDFLLGLPDVLILYFKWVVI